MFRKKINGKEMLEILDLGDLPCQHLHIVYLMWEARLTQTHKFLKPGIHFYKDEVLALRDSTHPALQTLRRNQTLGKDCLIKQIMENTLHSLGR